jgi:hypothetical protein
MNIETAQLSFLGVSCRFRAAIIFTCDEGLKKIHYPFVEIAEMKRKMSYLLVKTAITSDRTRLLPRTRIGHW